MAPCPERDELQNVALNVLQTMIDITETQQEAVRKGDVRQVEALDLKLETTFGKKSVRLALCASIYGNTVVPDRRLQA